jgi:hypothetical protein
LHLTYVIIVQSGREVIVHDCNVYGEDGGDARRSQNQRRLESHVDLKLNEKRQSVVVQFEGLSFCA